MTAPDADTREQVERVLDNHVRPGLSAHVGDVRVLEIDADRVELRLDRSCRSCYFRRACITHLIEPVLAESFGDRLIFNIR